MFCCVTWSVPLCCLLPRPPLSHLCSFVQAKSLESDISLPPHYTKRFLASQASLHIEIPGGINLICVIGYITQKIVWGIIGIVQKVFSEKASATARMRQKRVRNASKMRQNGSCFIGKRGTFQNASEMRQNCVENARNTFGGEHLLDNTEIHFAIISTQMVQTMGTKCSQSPGHVLQQTTSHLIVSPTDSSFRNL